MTIELKLDWRSGIALALFTGLVLFGAGYALGQLLAGLA